MYSSPEAPYEIHTDVKYAPLEVIEAGALADCVEKSWNQTLCRVNDSVARMACSTASNELFFVRGGMLPARPRGTDRQDRVRAMLWRLTQ